MDGSAAIHVHVLIAVTILLQGWVEYSAEWCSAVHCIAVQCSAVQYSAVQFSTVHAQSYLQSSFSSMPTSEAGTYAVQFSTDSFLLTLAPNYDEKRR